MFRPTVTEGTPELLQAIGRVASNWTSLEVTLDMLVAILFHKGGGSRGDVSIPISIKQKLVFIKACLRDHTGLQAHRERGRAVAGKVKSLSNDRNWILHGMLWEAQLPDAKGYEFRKVEFSNPKLHRIVKRRLTVECINAIADEIAEAKQEALSFVLFIGDHVFSLWTDETTA